MVDIPGLAYWRAQRDQRMVGGRPQWELEELRAMMQLVQAPAMTMTDAAAPLQQYPTAAHVEQARQAGYGYGSGYEGYIQGDLARVMGQGAGSRFRSHSAAALGLDLFNVTDPRHAHAVDPRRNREVSGWLPEEFYAQGALAANRIPLAALGFDPDRTAVDVKARGQEVSGVYSPKHDRMYAVVRSGERGEDRSTIVHESVHRGLEMLRKSRPKEVEKLLDEIGWPEETITRALMAKYAGDPEATPKGRGARSLLESGRIVFEDKKAMAALERLNELAQQEIARRKPGGPR